MPTVIETLPPQEGMNMRVGLLRHFRVNKPLPKGRFISQTDLLQWFDETEEAEVELSDVEMGDIEWQGCYSSDLPRALATAQHVHSGEIIPLSALREVRLDPLFKRNIRLPLLVWAVLTKFAFNTSHRSQEESPALLARRVEGVLDDILAEEQDVLIVSHGLIMLALKSELKRRGFTGPDFKTPLNAKLYVYET